MKILGHRTSSYLKWYSPCNLYILWSNVVSCSVQRWYKNRNTRRFLRRFIIRNGICGHYTMYFFKIQTKLQYTPEQSLNYLFFLTIRTIYKNRNFNGRISGNNLIDKFLLCFCSGLDSLFWQNRIGNWVYYRFYAVFTELYNMWQSHFVFNNTIYIFHSNSHTFQKYYHYAKWYILSSFMLYK